MRLVGHVARMEERRGACSWYGNLRERGDFQGLGLDRIIFKRILKKKMFGVLGLVLCGDGLLV